MKTLGLILFVCIQIYFQPNNNAQSLPFLNLNPSPELNGLALSGVSFPNDDPFGFYYNPAMLGYSSKYNNLSTQFYTNQTNWLENEFYPYRSFAINLGYNFNREMKEFNLSFGAGFIHNTFHFDYGEIALEKDSYNAFGLGASVDYYVTLSLGFTTKSIHSDLGLHLTDANAIDYGILLLVPIVKLFDDNLSFKINNKSILKPSINYSVGYSRLNLGDEVYYTDPEHSNPLPLTARLGHTITLGINYKANNLSLNLIKYSLILEADDILVSKDSIFYKHSSQGVFGDIDVWKNLVLLKGNNNVLVHRGHSIQLLETVTILLGSLDGKVFNASGINETDGVIISSSGFLKWLNSVVGTDFSYFVSNHLKINYIISYVHWVTHIKTKFSGISIALTNFSFN